MKTCEGKIKYVFRGRYHIDQTDILSNLESFGIFVAAGDYEAGDYEAYLKRNAEADDSAMLQWTAERVPVSVSVSVNFENFESAKCVVKRDPGELVSSLADHLTVIQESSKVLAKSKSCLNFGSLM